MNIHYLKSIAFPIIQLFPVRPCCSMEIIKKEHHPPCDLFHDIAL